MARKNTGNRPGQASSNVISLQRVQDIAFAYLCCFQEVEWINRGGMLGDTGQGGYKQGCKLVT